MNTNEAVPKEIETLNTKIGVNDVTNDSLKGDNDQVSYYELFHNTLNGIALHEMIYDKHGTAVDYRFIEANEAFEEHTGLIPSEIIGKTVVEVIPGIENSDFIQIYGKIALGGEPMRFEQYSEQLKKHYDINVYSPKNNFFVTVFMDITNQKLLEIERENRNKELEVLVAERSSELELAQEKLIRKESLALVGELTAGVGHEIRNPIACISNAVFYLQNVITDSNEKVFQYLGLISEEVNTIEGILSDLLNFSRVMKSSKEYINLETTILKLINKTFKPDNVSVEYEFDENLPEILFDEGHLIQIINNLYLNSIQAMKNGGKIIIKGIKLDDEVSIQVVDEGVGIAEENLGNIFEPLYTTKAKGIGLGLPLVKRYCEANGSTISVKSEVGAGTTFSMNVPII